jgi:hypothetical protein
MSYRTLFEVNELHEIEEWKIENVSQLNLHSQFGRSTIEFFLFFFVDIPIKVIFL